MVVFVVRNQLHLEAPNFQKRAYLKPKDLHYSCKRTSKADFRQQKEGKVPYSYKDPRPVLSTSSMKELGASAYWHDNSELPSTNAAKIRCLDRSLANAIRFACWLRGGVDPVRVLARFPRDSC